MTRAEIILFSRAQPPQNKELLRFIYQVIYFSMNFPSRDLFKLFTQAIFLFCIYFSSPVLYLQYEQRIF